MVLQRIVLAIEENEGEINGTEELALKVPGTKQWVIEQARKLAKLGHIDIIRSRGGRGQKTVYKINRNSPGLPRKTQRKKAVHNG